MAAPQASFDQAVALLQKSKDKIFDLVIKEATPDQLAKWLRLPLKHAVHTGDVDLVRDLLAAGDEGNCWGGFLDRNLMCAAVEDGSREMVSALLSAGVEPDVNVSEAHELLLARELAASRGHHAVEKLVKEAEKETACVEGYECSPLVMAVRCGNRQLVSDLLAGGAKADFSEPDCPSALHTAVLEGHEEMVPVLMQAGAEVDTVCWEGFTPLHTAAHYGELSMMKTLLAAGATVDFYDEMGHTALHRACIVGDVNVMRVLLQHGANANSVDRKGSSPLHRACSHLQIGAVDMLLRWGADETSVDSSGRLPWKVTGRGFRGRRRSKAGDITRVRTALKRAAADKAWRRRGLLVLCRSSHHRAMLARSAEDPIAVEVAQENSISCRTRSKVSRMGECSSVRHSSSGHDGVGAGAGTQGDVEQESGDLSDCVEARVVELEEEVIFRYIVGFL